jgi:hypothetical protein
VSGEVLLHSVAQKRAAVGTREHGIYPILATELISMTIHGCLRGIIEPVVSLHQSSSFPPTSHQVPSFLVRQPKKTPTHLSIHPIHPITAPLSQPSLNNPESPTSSASTPVPFALPTFSLLALFLLSSSSTSALLPFVQSSSFTFLSLFIATNLSCSA